MNSFIKPKSMLLKSCSFAGFSNHQSPNEPVPEQLSLVSSNCETSTTSGGETDEEHVRRYSRYNKDKYNLNLAEEQLSSLSDTWDNYQVRISILLVIPGLIIWILGKLFV